MHQILAFLLSPMWVLVIVGVLTVIFYIENFSKYKGTLRPFHLFEPYGFNVEDIPDLTGKTIVVTGASSGLGYGTARQLAKHGADVIMAVPSKERGEDAKKSMGDVKGKLTVMQLDNGSLTSVRRFAEAIKALNRPLYSLILNAGIMAPPFSLTEDGLEAQFQVNFIAHAALARELLPYMDPQGSSILFVSSAAMHHSVKDGVFTELAKINDERSYSGMMWYGQSKLADAVYAKELARRLGPNSSIICNAVHPGGVQGHLTRFFTGENPFLLAFDGIVEALIYWPKEIAALTVLGASIGPKTMRNKITGKYFVPIFREDNGSPELDDSSLAKRVWDFTEYLLAERGWKLPEVSSASHFPPQEVRTT